MAKKFKKGDQVLVIAGSSKGKKGAILRTDGDKVVVEGVNIATIHKKPTSQEAGKIVKLEKPIHVSNVSHIEDDKPVKVGFDILEGEGKLFSRKVRISKKTRKKIA